MLLFIGGIVWARLTQLSDGDAPATRQGAAALKRALQGDTEAFGEAREHFQRAARGIVWDGYPLFALSLTEQLARGDVQLSDETLRPVIDALRGGRIDDARRALGRLDHPDKYRWLQRLLDDMG